MSNIDLLEGFLDLEPFSQEVKRSPRTVRRWLEQRDGLPYTRLGNRILIHVPTARDWLFGRMRGRNPPRRPRRQREAAAHRATVDQVRHTVTRPTPARPTAPGKLDV